MRYYVILLLFISSCANEIIKETESNTSDSTMSQVLFLRSQLDSIVVLDSTTKAEKQYLLLRCDSLIKRQLDYNDIIIDSKYLLLKVSSIIKAKSVLQTHTDSLVKINKRLIIENQQTKEWLNETRKEVRVATGQKNDYKNKFNKATKPSVAMLQATGIGVSKNILGKTRESVTNKQGKIRKVRLSFVIPYSEFAKKGKINITGVIYSVDKKNILNKDTVVNYDGSEMMISIDVPIGDFKTGSHDCAILFDLEEKGKTSIKVY